MAKKLTPVKCRVCKQVIDRNNEAGWMMGAKNYYYHTSCYENFFAKERIARDSTYQEVEQLDEAGWFDLVYRYLKFDLKIDIDWVKFQSQWTNFTKKNMTPKGIFFTLRYYYDVQHNKPQSSRGGIGIVPYLYEESATYWINKEQHDRGVCARIEQQILASEIMKPVVITQTARKPKHKAIDLASIAEGDEE